LDVSAPRWLPEREEGNGVSAGGKAGRDTL
jgi:hypothetical protein